MGLVHISLMTNDVERLFLCSFAICISSLVKCVIKCSGPLKTELFLLLECESFPDVSVDCSVANRGQFKDCITFGKVKKHIFLITSYP